MAAICIFKISSCSSKIVLTFSWKSKNSLFSSIFSYFIMVSFIHLTSSLTNKQELRYHSSFFITIEVIPLDLHCQIPYHYVHYLIFQMEVVQLKALAMILVFHPLEESQLIRNYYHFYFSFIMVISLNFNFSFNFVEFNFDFKLKPISQFQVIIISIK